jgi:hypothetical protein
MGLMEFKKETGLGMYQRPPLYHVDMLEWSRCNKQVVLHER